MATRENLIEEVRRLNVHIANLKLDHANEVAKLKCDYETKIANLTASLQMQEAA